jgi:hypothetical protein
MTYSSATLSWKRKDADPVDLCRRLRLRDRPRADEATSEGGNECGIVALARRLAIALWRYLEHGVIPAGATLKPIPPVSLEPVTP